MPEHNRDPDSILHLLDDWTDIQLEGFFRRVGAPAVLCVSWAGFPRASRRDSSGGRTLASWAGGLAPVLFSRNARFLSTPPLLTNLAALALTNPARPPSHLSAAGTW